MKVLVAVKRVISPECTLHRTTLLSTTKNSDSPSGCQLNADCTECLPCVICCGSPPLGEMTRLTARSEQPPCAEAVVVSPDGNHVAFMRDIAGWPQIFVVSLNG